MRTATRVVAFALLNMSLVDGSQGQEGLRLELANALGVTAVFDVAGLERGTVPVPSFAEGLKWPSFQLDAQSFVRFPWEDITQVHRDGKQQVVVLKSGEKLVGRFGTSVVTIDGKSFDLATATTIKVLKFPKRYPFDRPMSWDDAVRKGSAVWSLAVPGKAKLEVIEPSFNYSYVSSSGFVIGSATHQESGSTFFVESDGERIKANIDDFVSLNLAPKSSTRDSTIRVKARGKGEVVRDFLLIASDDRGEHEAEYNHLTFALKSGLLMATKSKSWTLTRLSGGE